MPGIWCGSHKEIAVDDFVALVIIETVILLVGPAPALFLSHYRHAFSLANFARCSQRKLALADNHRPSEGFAVFGRDFPSRRILRCVTTSNSYIHELDINSTPISNRHDCRSNPGAAAVYSRQGRRVSHSYPQG